MSIQHLATSLELPMDIFAVFACAVCGAFVAVRKDFDFFATVLLAEAASLGGGLSRDLVIGVRPVSFTEPAYYLAPIVAASIVYFSTVFQRHERAVDVCDAVALGLLSVTGTTKGLAHDFDYAPAAALGMATAVGGGILCHVLARELPPVLRWDQDLYALPGLVGAGATVLLYATKGLNVATAVAAALLAAVVRLLAVRYGWRTPRSLTWREQARERSAAAEAAPPEAEAPRARAPRHARPEPALADAAPVRSAAEDTIRMRLPQGLAESRPFADPRVSWEIPQRVRAHDVTHRHRTIATAATAATTSTTVPAATEPRTGPTHVSAPRGPRHR